jgi:hypothetical protein
VKSLVRLLERWAERENVRTNGRALIIPETKYRWAVNPIGGFYIVAEGVCWERSTATHTHDLVDEFGHCFRSLSNFDQGIIIVGHFGDKAEWEELVKSSNLSSGKSRHLLKLAWLRLLKNWIRREREWREIEG